jgi:hypothetical protein
MAIIPSLLVSAAILQDYLVDNATGLPLADGNVSLYKDNSRTTFKNWYYLSGSPGSYTYITLPNPMTLNGVGTIQDGSGNDVIPFFYPYSEADNETQELYYIVVTNSNGQQQFTRQNFPFGAYEAITPVISTGFTLRNYIVNNVFWRNTGVVTDENLMANPNSGYNEAVLAPSSHDGFSMPDWRYISDVSGGNDTLTFIKFAAGSFLNSPQVEPQNLDVTPEYYINFTCTSAGTSSYKYIQVPLSLHVKTLESVPAVFVIWARCTSSSGTGGSTITLTTLPYMGTGTTSPMVSPVETFELPINSVFTKLITQPFEFQTAVGLPLGSGGDDAWYLQIGYSSSATFNIDIAKVQLYFGDQIPSNDGDLYDKVDSIISSPRTGDIRISVNQFYPFGWVPMDDGTIGSASSGATTRANIDTWPLYNTLWSAFNSSNPAVLNIYTNAATTPKTASTFGASAISDWNAGKQLQLTQMLGRVLIGTAPDMPIPITFTTNSSTTYTVTSGSLANVNNGMPVKITANTAGMGQQPYFNVIYYIQVLSASTFTLYSYFDAQNGFSSQITAGGSSSDNTLQISDGFLGLFSGANYAQGGTPSDGYPASITTGASALLTRPPATYMNFYIKL